MTESVASDEQATRPRSEEPDERRLERDGVSLTYFEWPGDGRPLLLVHAAGFHARVWDAVCRRLPGRRIIALDLRGHGRSDKIGIPGSWDLFGEDIAHLVRTLDLRDAIGVGHSMGGRCVTMGADLVPDAFAGLLLVETIMPLTRPRRPRQNGGPADYVRKRRNEWASPEEMLERFMDRAPYSAWDPEVLADFIRWGLLPNPDGEGYVLACPPDVEAGVYATNTTGPVMRPIMAGLDLPVIVVRARQLKPGQPRVAFATSSTPPQLASLFPDAEDVVLPERSHFVPMEDPGIVADYVAHLDERIDARLARR